MLCSDPSAIHPSVKAIWVPAQSRHFVVQKHDQMRKKRRATRFITQASTKTLHINLLGNLQADFFVVDAGSRGSKSATSTLSEAMSELISDFLGRMPTLQCANCKAHNPSIIRWAHGSHQMHAASFMEVTVASAHHDAMALFHPTRQYAARIAPVAVSKQSHQLNANRRRFCCSD